MTLFINHDDNGKVENYPDRPNGRMTPRSALVDGKLQIGGASGAVEQPPTITTVQGDIPTWQYLEAVGFDFEATGGETPYTWTVSAGTLPGTLILDTDGHLHGTVTEVALASVTIRCTGSNSEYDEEVFTLETTTPVLPGSPTFILDVEEQTDLTGSNYNSLQDSSGNGFNLALEAAQTKAIKDSGVQLDGIDTIDTNGAYCWYSTSAGIDLAGDIFPNSGVGSMIVVFNADVYANAFGSNYDFIIGGRDDNSFISEIITGPAASAKASAIGHIDIDTAISTDTWYVQTSRWNATSIKSQIDNGTELEKLGDAHITSTARLSVFAHSGSGSRFDGHIAIIILWPTVLSDGEIIQAKSYLKYRFPSLSI